MYVRACVVTFSRSVGSVTIPNVISEIIFHSSRGQSCEFGLYSIT